MMAQPPFDRAEPLRLAIIGLGFGARVHLPALLSIPGVCVVGVADSGSGRARQIVAGISRDVRVWAGWRGAVEATDVDAVSVATPPHLQADIVCAALAAGKHVLCEKPFGVNAQHAGRMWTSAQSAGRANAVNFEFRMEPGIAAVKQLVKAGEIGAVHRIGVRWLTAGGLDPSMRWSWRHDVHQGGGVLNAFVSHVVDYLEWIFESLISRVSARCETVVRERTDAEGRTRTVTAEDHCELACDLATGACGQITVSNSALSELGHRIEVQGDRGRLVYLHEPPFTPDKASLRVEINSRPCRMVPLEPLSGSGGPDTRIAPFRALAERFVWATSGSAVEDLADFGCGFRVQQVLDTVRESSRRGKTVPVTERLEAAPR
jgi:predicted dehydrogenase